MGGDGFFTRIFSSLKNGGGRWWASFFTHTNEDMLILKTYNMDREPNAHRDDLCLKFFSALHPLKAKFISLLNIDLGRTVPGGVNYLDARAQCIDEVVLAAIGGSHPPSPRIQQIVVLGSGFCTVSIRHATPGVRFFEVDLPSVINRKKKLLRKLKVTRDQSEERMAQHELNLIPLVLGRKKTSDLVDALVGTGFDPEVPSLFIVEGLLYYLPAQGVEELLRTIGARLMAPQSLLVLDFLHLDAVREGTRRDNDQEQAVDAAITERYGTNYTRFKKLLAGKGEPLLSGIPADEDACRAFFRRFDLELTELMGGDDLARRFLPHLVPCLEGQGCNMLPWFSLAKCGRISE